MKKVLFLLLLFFTVNSFSQEVIVDDGIIKLWLNDEGLYVEKTTQNNVMFFSEIAGGESNKINFYDSSCLQTKQDCANYSQVFLVFPYKELSGHYVIAEWWVYESYGWSETFLVMFYVE